MERLPRWRSELDQVQRHPSSQEKLPRWRSELDLLRPEVGDRLPGKASEHVLEGIVHDEGQVGYRHHRSSDTEKLPRWRDEQVLENGELLEDIARTRDEEGTQVQPRFTAQKRLPRWRDEQVLGVTAHENEEDYQWPFSGPKERFPRWRHLSDEGTMPVKRKEKAIHPPIIVQERWVGKKNGGGEVCPLHDILLHSTKSCS